MNITIDHRTLIFSCKYQWLIIDQICRLYIVLTYKFMFNIKTYEAPVTNHMIKIVDIYNSVFNSKVFCTVKLLYTYRFEQLVSR